MRTKGSLNRSAIFLNFKFTTMSITAPSAPESHNNLTKSAKKIKAKKDGDFIWWANPKLRYTFSTLEKMENFKLNNPQYEIIK